MQLAHPQYLWLFLLYVPLIVWYILKQHNARPYMALSSTASFARLPGSWRQWARHLLFGLRLAAVGCLITVYYKH
ncbi:MAG: BatA domain-containing protein, partial [Muribaculaceae bacterium]|nr:BatA domain-containing protein [Muribaculaceae bacterium]